MKNGLLTTISLVSLAWALPASAADAPRVAPAAPPPAYEAAPLPPAVNWSGFYLGGHAGWGWGDIDTTLSTAAAGWPDRVPGASEDFNPDGFLGGGQIGYLQQWNNFVAGIEVAVSGTDIDDRQSSSFGALDDELKTDVDWLVTATARLGYAWGQWLPYIKGGYAGGDVDLSITDTVPANVGAWGDNKWHDGYTIGAGIEYMFTPSWTFGVEYSFIDLGRETHSGLDSNASPHAERVDIELHQVIGRINYKFSTW